MTGGEKEESVWKCYLLSLSLSVPSMKRNKNRTEDSHRLLERRVGTLNETLQEVANEVRERRGEEREEGGKRERGREGEGEGEGGRGEERRGEERRGEERRGEERRGEERRGEERRGEERRGEEREGGEERERGRKG